MAVRAYEELIVLCESDFLNKKIQLMTRFLMFTYWTGEHQQESYVKIKKTSHVSLFEGDKSSNQLSPDPTKK